MSNSILHLPKEWEDLFWFQQVHGDISERTLGNFRVYCIKVGKIGLQNISGEGEAIHRATWFSFLGEGARAYTAKQAAFRLGMGVSSFREVLRALNDPISCYSFYPFHPHPESDLFPKDYVRSSLIDALTFRDYSLRRLLNSKVHGPGIAALHDKIRDSLGVPVISVKAEGAPNMYADDYCSITGAPINCRESVWMNFGLPVSLIPDSCSKQLFQENKELLTPFLFLKETENE